MEAGKWLNEIEHDDLGQCGRLEEWLPPTLFHQGARQLENNTLSYNTVDTRCRE